MFCVLHHDGRANNLNLFNATQYQISRVNDRV